MERVVEELTLNAWPALQTCLYDGWLLRFADGFTRRANSVNPLYPSTLPLDEKVAACEEAYRARRLETVFKLTAASEPAGLDAFLDARGYRRVAETSVQLADLGALAVEPDPDVAVADAPPEGWLEALCRGDGMRRHLPTVAAMLRATGPATGFAALRLDGEIVGIGLAVAERGYVGLFDVVTAPEARNRGVGRRVVRQLLGWGRARGAGTAHLAVMRDNGPALRLYAGQGFREVYRYWYRVDGAR